MRIEIETIVHVVDEARLREHYVSNDLGDDDDLSAIVADVVVDPDTAPLDYGCEIVDKSATELADGNWSVVLVVDVTDPAAVAAEASRCRLRLGGGAADDATPKTLGTEIHEIMTVSNSNPSPLDIGFEIMSVRNVIDHVLEAGGHSPRTP